jgi:putative transposase
VLSEHGVPIAPRTFYAWVGRPRRNGPCGMPRSPRSWPATYEPDEHGRRTPESLYGSLKMWAHLQREGIPVAKSTVERLMRRNGWQGVRRQKKVRTTIPDPSAVRPPDLVDRQFGVPAPNPAARGRPVMPTSALQVPLWDCLNNGGSGPLGRRGRRWCWGVLADRARRICGPRRGGARRPGPAEGAGHRRDPPRKAAMDPRRSLRPLGAHRPLGHRLHRSRRRSGAARTGRRPYRWRQSASG